MSIDTTKARLYYCNGEVEHFDNQPLAYSVYLALPSGIQVAFRSAGDCEPVYAWGYLDKPKT